MFKGNHIMKRAFDSFASLIGVLIISPILILISISIKISSKGPVFFTQERLGLHGHSFKVIKFRTMIENAEAKGSGLVVRDGNDTRITQVGKFLRSTSLDELPQIFNVLKGDMSLVGPRPPVPHHPYKYIEYSERQRRRFTFKPGITGLAQVSVRNSVSWDERIEYDLKYIDNFNFMLDIRILWKTAKKLFVGESIYLENKESKG